MINVLILYYFRGNLVALRSLFCLHMEAIYLELRVMRLYKKFDEIGIQSPAFRGGADCYSEWL